MPRASPSNTRNNYFKLWQCVSISIAMDDGTCCTRAGYIFGKKDHRGRYSVDIPSMGISTKATKDMLTPRNCSDTMKQKIADHKRLIRRRR